MAVQASSSARKNDGLKTKYGLRQSFEPLYTGGASTALTSDGVLLFAPMNDVIQCTNTLSGRVVARIPSDLEEVTAVAITPDQSTLIVASRSLALRIIALRFDKQNDDPSSLSLTWSLQRTISKTHDAPIVVMRVDPTSTLVATGSSDTCAKVWDIRGGYCTHVLRGHGGVVSSLAWCMGRADGKVELYSGSIDGKVRQWDLQNSGSGKPVDVLETHFSVVRGLDVSLDGRRMVSAGRDRMVALWEMRKGRWRLVDTLTASESLESAGFLSDNGETFWTAGVEGEVRVWSFTRMGVVLVQPNGRFARGQVTQTKKEQNGEDDEEEEDANETRAVTEVHWLARSNTLVTVHADQEIVFRSAKTLKRIRQLAGFTDQIIDGVLLSKDDQHRDSHLAVATNSTFIRVYALHDEAHTVDVLPADGEEGHTGLILCLDKTNDGRWLASGGKDREVRIWAFVPQPDDDAGLPDDEEIGVRIDRDEKQNTPMGWSCVAVAKGHTESVGALAFARRPLVPEAVGAPFLVTGSQDRTAKVWDLSGLQRHIEQHFTVHAHATQRTPLTLHSLTTLKIHEKDINALDVSPNNALLLSGSQDKTAKVHTINYQAPSKANHLTASASLSAVTTCRGHKRGVWSVAFSPVDAVFLTASSDRTLKLWSINDGFTCVKNYVGHTNSVLRVRFLRGGGPNAKGVQCISCASDGLVKVWNVRTEECLDTLDGHEERVWALDCSHDGDVIVSGGADGVLRFWHDETKQREEEALQSRQRAVEQEQTFGNLLAANDYRNAISLALAMRQPRRLFDLFTAVDQQRQWAAVKGEDATAVLLREAMQGVDDSKRSLRDPALTEVLSRAGILSSSSTTLHSQTEQKTEASVTGSKAVDEVIATLQPAQLAALLTFVRDWNTIVRTANVAQTVLHAILRFHTADAIIDAFDAHSSSVKEEEKKRRQTAKANASNVLEALLPYTRRHYERSDRILTESAMLDYTLANMDAILGVDDDDDEEVEKEEGLNGRAKQDKEGDVLMESSESDSSDDEESD